MLREFVSVYESGETGEKYRGHLAYNLCSALPAEHTSPETKAKIAEWSLRFKAPDAAPPEARAYWKVSPISKEAATSFSDDQWLQAIAIHNTERGEFNPEHPEYGGSIQLSGVMGELMKESPERYARLGLRLPLDAEMYYWTTMLRGAASSGVPDDLKLELAQRAFDFPDQGRLKATLDLLAGIVTNRLSNPAIAFIKRMATHVDPSTESEADDPDAASSGLLVTGINTIRGHASHAICELICRDRAYAEIFHEAIDQLGTDNDIAVRAAACGLLLPLASIDIPKAFALLEQLAQPDERLLASGQAEEFLSVYLESQTDSVRPHIVRMMQSPHDDVRKVGAQLACLAKLYHKEETENAELAMAGDQALRLGACEVARLNLAYSACRDWCAQALTRFFNDEDVEVRRLAAGGFWALWQAPEESLLPYGGLIETFIKSAAFSDDPSYLFHALEDNRLQLPDIVLDACCAFIERCSDQAHDTRTASSLQADSVSTLIFRAYAQLRKPELRMQALSLIDMMCLEGLQSAGKRLADFER